MKVTAMQQQIKQQEHSVESDYLAHNMSGIIQLL